MQTIKTVPSIMTSCADTPQKNPVNRLTLLHFLVLTLFIVISYYPSLDVPFIFDDLPNIVLNPAVQPQNASELTKVLHSPISSSRPLALFSLAVNFLISGQNVMGYHLVNIAIHIANCLLLYLMILILLQVTHKNRPEVEPSGSRFQALSFVGAGLWAVNPVQTQAVTYIVQRMTSMAAFFYLAGLLLFLLLRTRRIRPLAAWIAISASFVCGMASKEIVATLPLALILIDLLLFKKPEKKTLLWLAVAVLTFAGIGLFALGGHLPDWTARYPNRNFSPMERVMTQWRVLWHYLSLYALPLPGRLHLTYDDYLVSRSLISPWTTLAGLFGIVGVLTLAWKIRRRYALTALGIFFFFLASSVEASFINIELVYIHRLYLPSIFLPIVFISLIPAQQFKRLTILFIGVMALLSYWTIERNVSWQDKEKFWQTDLNAVSSSPRALNNQAAALIDAGDFTAAIDLLKQMPDKIQTYEDHRIMLYNLGYANFYQGNFSEALKQFTLLTDRYGSHKNAYLFMGKIFLTQGDVVKARIIAEKLQLKDEYRYQGKILAALMAESQTDLIGAERILADGLTQITPDQVEPYMQMRLELARIYLKEKKAKEAYEIFLDITQKFPQNYSAWTMIYRMLEAGGDKEGAGKVERFLTSKGVIIKKGP